MTHQTVTNILCDIALGTLSPRETGRRLMRQIDRELAKGPRRADMDMIVACTDLLGQLLGTHAPGYDDRMEHNWAAIERRAAQRTTASRPRPLLRPLVAAILILLLLTAVAYGTWSLFQESDRTNREEYVIESVGSDEVFPNISHIITDSEEVVDYTTTNFQEVVDFLGYKPYVPDAIFRDWRVIEFHVSVAAYQVVIDAHYSNILNPDKCLSFSSRYFMDVNGIGTTYEYNGHGTFEVVEDIEIYFTQNTDWEVALWSIDNVLYDLSGEMTKDMLKMYVKAIIGGLQQ